MLLAHITFDIPYVIFSVLPRLRRMNPNTYEAALDLGAKPFTALRKVLLPEIMPGVITGALLAFTMSLDDLSSAILPRCAPATCPCSSTP